ncbi:MAG: flagellar basal body protein [Ramlibacter sp.]|jgi:flagellar basal-body rod protein FlgB|nr:flagellar basal body protein [Ramlibacter sp.]MCE3270985.1 flagellar basal body protein [Ramlibacter sp.]
MAWNIDAITTAALSAALAAGASRQAAVASNIANAGTEGYVPLRLAFDATLEDARAALLERGSLDPSHISAMRGRLEPVLDAAGVPTRVQLDAEMAELAGNSVHFQALLQGLSRHLSILAIAAADGRK